MTLLVAWIAFPIALGVLALGCGLIVDVVAGAKLPGTLLLPCGLALMTVVGVLFATSDTTATLTLPAIVALTIAGFGIGARRRQARQIDRWALAAALGVFAVFAAPVVLSGEATFAGYIKLDDTATWLAISDRIAEHGTNFDNLAPSSYMETLRATIGDGYPVGSFFPLAIARPLVGLDAAWVFQPYLAMLAAMLALVLYELAGGLLESRRLRALSALIAAQPALLFGYALWGGVKELGVALLVATFAALVPVVLKADRAARCAVAPALVIGALVAVLSFGGLAWIGPMLVGALVLALKQRGFRVSPGKAIGLAALALFVATPALLSASTYFSTASKSALAGSELGNLLKPLSNLQAFGIWPAGDFRLRPEDLTATYLLIALVVAAGLWGVVCAWRKRSWGLLLYVGSVALTCIVLVAFGSPWIDGKALAASAPAFLLAAMAGATALVQGGRRIEGAILIVAIAGGVLWSNALAYHEVMLAPRDQLAELEQIAEDYDGEGPMLMTEYQPYGVRHFLRGGDAEGASELRSRVIPLIGGKPLGKGEFADIDQFDQRALSDFPVLVLRRSPVASRPPLGYQLARKGRYYEVWQRAPGATLVSEHLPLGDPVQPVGRADCAELERLARQLGPGGRLAYVERPRVITVRLPDIRHPASWTTNPATPGMLYPDGSGTVATEIAIPRQGRYGVWLGGSVRGEVSGYVDGRKTGSVRHQLNNNGMYLDLGSAALDPGIHTVELRHRAGQTERPGSGGTPFGIGPLVIAPDSIDSRVRYVGANDVRKLCGRDLDWVEAAPAG